MVMTVLRHVAVTVLKVQLGHVKQPPVTVYMIVINQIFPETRIGGWVTNVTSSYVRINKRAYYISI